MLVYTLGAHPVIHMWSMGVHAHVLPVAWHVRICTCGVCGMAWVGMLDMPFRGGVFWTRFVQESDTTRTHTRDALCLHQGRVVEGAH